MESSAVYMCFPCYQEFDTLEEVLKHQLTCTAGEEQANPSGASATAVTIPMMQAQQKLINISSTIAVPQIQVQAEASTVQFDDSVSQTEADDAVTSDQPRILYQCGDCDELFKTLELWQKHRKEEACRQPDESQSKPDSQPEEETVADQGPPSNDGAEASPNTLKPQPQDESQAQEEIEQVSEPVPSASVESPAQSSVPPPPPPPQVAPSTSTTEDWSPRRRGANKKPKPEPVLLCVDCGSCFGLVSELVAHRKTQHGFEEALHRCTVCGESFLNTTLFLYHRKQHIQSGEMHTVPEAEPKEGAGNHDNGIDEQGKDGPDTSTSVSSTFPQPELFLCTVCGQNFSGEQGLIAHREQKHDMKRPLHTCAHCGGTFMNTTKYLYHCREHRLKTSTEEGVDANESTEIATTKTQSTKRPLLPSALGSPVAKKSRPIVRILKGAHARKEKDETENTVGKDGHSVELKSNPPPPAKLLQDWSRTPLPHVCPYCGKTFTRRVFLRTHVYSHTGEKLFTCKLCMKAFTNSQSLLRHSISHTGNRPYSCDVCGKCFSQLAALNRHQRIHMATHPRRRRGRKPVCVVDSDGHPHIFACPHCPSRFATESQLNDHKLFHTSHPFPCPDCGQAFTRRKELDLHTLTHQDKQPAACPHCSSQFVNQSVLMIHLQRCPITEEERNAGRGRGQGRGRSTGQLECDLCGHRCMTQEGLELHRLSHTGQTPLKCPVRPCRRRFTSNGALEEHVLAHFQGTLGKSKNKTRFRCQICQKEFAYNSTFTVHMRTHTDERPYQCSTCNKRFRQLPHLQDHERIHSGLRPFCCWICGKSFSVAARLTEHARIHSGEKPYPCPHCMAAFRSRSNLDKHMHLHEDMETETSEQAMQAAEVAQVQKVLEGATVLSSLAGTGEVEAGSVQTIYVLQGAEGGSDTVMIPSDQFSGMEGASQVVILPSSVLGAQGISVPTITMDGNEITMVEQGQSPQHTIEFIVEETV